MEPLPHKTSRSSVQAVCLSLRELSLNKKSIGLGSILVILMLFVDLVIRAYFTYKYNSPNVLLAIRRKLLSRNVFACPRVAGSVGTYMAVSLSRSDFVIIGDSDHLFLAVVLAAKR